MNSVDILPRSGGDNTDLSLVYARKEQRLSERSRGQEVSKRVAAETADDIV